MAIGKTSRMSSVRSSLRAPKFLDKASGFYGRLDEPASTSGERDAEEEKQNSTTDGSGPTAAPHGGHGERREETFDFGEGLMEDDGETLLRRKPSRRSSRWRRSSRKKQKEAEPEEDAPQDAKPAPSTENGPDAMSPAAPEVTGTEPEELGLESVKKNSTEEEQEGRGTEEPAHIHFREEEDDQVLIRDKKRGREEEEEEVGEEERRMRREQEQGMKVVKRHTVKTYRKALDRAFRRGWEAFVTNLYSVTLTPVNSSSSPSSKTKHQHNVALAEFR